MIFDCFTFLNELEVLELRLMELYDTVDYFVLVEANKTHTGNPKGFIFEEHRDIFMDYWDKIIYVKVTDLPAPNPANPWNAEKFQRNAITRGLTNAKAGDKILVSDVDEIPNVDVIKDNLNNPQWAIAFQQHMYYFYVNCQLVGHPWSGTVMSSVGDFDTPQRLRGFTKRRISFNYIEEPFRGLYPNGGWHYSFLTGNNPARAKYKADNTVDFFNNIGLTIEDITERINKYQDIYGRKGWKFRQSIVDISDNKPRTMDKFLEKYPYFLLEKQ